MAQRRLCCAGKATQKCFSQCEGHGGFGLAEVRWRVLKAGSSNVQRRGRSSGRGGSVVRGRGHDKPTRKAQARETGHHVVGSEGGVKLNVQAGGGGGCDQKADMTS